MKALLSRHAAQRLRCVLLLLAAACTRPPAMAVPQTTPTGTAVPTATAYPHAPEIRFALIGNLAASNVWALFDSKGYSYNNYAVRSGYWPRLYSLSIPDGQFQAEAAAGMPSAVEPEGALYTAVVPLRGDLQWTDGSPFTARDVAFTVNTALDFQLGFDWRAYYDPAWLDHAEALDEHNVKFYFKRAPDVSMWQYGALQGPIVQEAYWAPKVKDALALLPPADSAANIAMLTGRIADLQKRVQALVNEGVTATGEQARQLQLELQRRQGDLDEATNNLNKAQAAVDGAMQAARAALYALDEVKEPTLGTWMPVNEDTGKWVNEANPAYPFARPHFDRAVYLLYPDEDSAIAAMQKGDVNSILETDGLSGAARSRLKAGVVENQGPSAYFLVVSPTSAALADPALRRALMCSISVATLSKPLLGSATPLSSFVLPGNAAWTTPSSITACGNPNQPAAEFDPSIGANMLRTAGYTWTIEPAGEQAGSGLKGPDGKPVPPLALLVPSGDEDVQSVQAARVVEHYANYLGIPLSVQPVDPSTIRYAVFNDRNYDMAIMGWRLSDYPGYLCEWFGAGNPFAYEDDQLGQACEKLQSTSDLDAARALMGQIQARLAEQLPFLPLYAVQTYDTYEGIRYPFEHVLRGLSGAYGAPAAAIPLAP